MPPHDIVSDISHGVIRKWIHNGLEIPAHKNYLMVPYSSSIHNFVIPNHIIHLEIRNSNCPLDGIPKTVKKLKLYDSVNIDQNKLKFITHLTIDFQYINFDISKLLFLTHLKFHYQSSNLNIIKLPPNITHLTFGMSDSAFNAIDIPKSVTHLTINNKFKFKIPLSVTHLKLDYEGPIPISVTHLTLKREPSQGVIPPSVTHLKLHTYARKKYRCDIPESVTHLEFGEKFAQQYSDLPYILPKSVTHLTFYSPNMKKIKGCIPKSVTHFRSRKM